MEVTSVKEEWEIISNDANDDQGEMTIMPSVSTISVSQDGGHQSSRAEACATVIVHPQFEGKQQVELNALSVSVDA